MSTSVQLELLPGPSSQQRKDRGAFFTPGLIADYMARWAIRQPSDTVLEPSCGEAVFLTAAGRRLRELGAPRNLRSRLVGLDIHEESVAIAQQELVKDGSSAELHTGNFFDFRSERSFDAVIGNPPYVRYQKFFGEAREKGLVAALAQGVRLPGLASSWAAFVIHAASFLKPEGRLAMVLPAELLSVNYAAHVRQYLMTRFAGVRLIMFEDRVFPEVQEEVILLLAEGEGPTDHCHLSHAQNLEALESPQRRRWVPGHSEDKWVMALVPTEAAETYTEASESQAFARLQDWGGTRLGMVTGSNKFFTFSAEEAANLGLSAEDVQKISPPGSRHLKGLTFTERMWREVLNDGRRCYLFDPDPSSLSTEAADYIREGESHGIHRAYKCRIRKPWWKVPKVDVPDLFLTYMNYKVPRLVANRARALYLNSIHGILLKPELRQLGMDLLPIASLNSLTLLGAELVGRSYGGGMLKLEPKEADQLPVPSPETLRRAQRSLRSLRPQLSRSLRNGDLETAMDLVDRALLRDSLRMSRSAVEKLRSARELMFERRKARSRGK